MIFLLRSMPVWFENDVPSARKPSVPHAKPLPPPRLPLKPLPPKPQRRPLPKRPPLKPLPRLSRKLMFRRRTARVALPLPPQKPQP